MKRYTPKQFQEIQRLHQLWLIGAKTGRRANLIDADLHGADLSGANLSGADLSGANLHGADLSGANLSGANLIDAYLFGANLSGANLSGADLRGANLIDAYLRDVNLSGADLHGANLIDADLHGANLKVSTLEVFTGLYQYACWAIVSVEGAPWVRMGCLWKTVEKWDRIGIRESNLSEFPNDGSAKCEKRVRAFEFTRNAALILAAAYHKES